MKIIIEGWGNLEKKSPTIQDVADLAGVSKATVSKYINDIPYVATKTRKKIADAIVELQFRPNTFARGLANKSLSLIGLVISDFQVSINMELIKAIEVESRKLGYNLVLVSTNDDNTKEEEVCEILINQYRHLDGIILANMRINSTSLSKLEGVFKNIVMVHRHVESVAVDYAVIDGYLGGKLAAEYLISQGHRNLAMISGPTNIFQFKERIEGFKSVLKEHGIEEQAAIIETDQSLEEGYRAAERIVFEHKLTTAIFASSDMLALGVLEAATQYGWDIPNEISLIGFDNIFFSKLARVPLTTIDSRMNELGVTAVKLLNERIKGRTTLEQIKLRPSLVVRDSCAKLSVPNK